jgi:hypothetical protein
MKQNDQYEKRTKQIANFVQELMQKVILDEIKIIKYKLNDNSRIEIDYISNLPPKIPKDDTRVYPEVVEIKPATKNPTPQPKNRRKP